MIAGADKRVILHLCADTGSDTWPYQMDPEYEVIRIGEAVGVENFTLADKDYVVSGIVANPVCTNFSAAKRGNYFGGGKREGPDLSDVWMVNECLRIIEEAQMQGALDWYVIENPASGRLRDYLGAPAHSYQPWEYGDPWTKHTGLWGDFTMPPPLYTDWEDVPKNPALYARPGRKPSIAFMHRAAAKEIPDFVQCFEEGMEYPATDADFRSLAPQGFARAFKRWNY